MNANHSMNINHEFLRPNELVQRWRNAVTETTLANWRCMKIGPRYLKLRGRILYPLDSVIEYERSHENGCAA